MASTSGTWIIAPIKPPDDQDTFATHEAIWGKGGLRTVDNIPQRNVVPPLRREEGMQVYVKSTQNTYRLKPGFSPTNPVLNDSDWEIATGGGGGGASSLDDLSDIDLTGLVDDQVLQYDDSSGLFKPATLVGGGTVTFKKDRFNPPSAGHLIYTLTNSPITDSESVDINGILYDTPRDYSIAGTTLTFVSNPFSTLLRTTDEIGVKYAY